MSAGTEPLPDWPRPHFTTPGDAALLVYVVFGRFSGPPALSRSRYRCDSTDGLTLLRYGPEQHPEVVASFREGFAWDALTREAPALADLVAQQPDCVIVRGEIADGPDLNVLRNAVGLIACLLDHGGVAVYDPQTLAWRTAAAWNEDCFAPAAPVPRQHVVILSSQLPDAGEWLQTRGLRKFGRPDLSIRGVVAEHREAVLDLLNRFIEFQAFGGVIDAREPIRMRALPAGMRCRHRGHGDDPDFDNVHVEIEWPDGASSAPVSA